jgi:hypothetical protein
MRHNESQTYYKEEVIRFFEIVVMTTSGGGHTVDGPSEISSLSVPLEIA